MLWIFLPLRFFWNFPGASRDFLDFGMSELFGFNGGASEEFWEFGLSEFPGFFQGPLGIILQYATGGPPITGECPTPVLERAI